MSKVINGDDYKKINQLIDGFSDDLEVFYTTTYNSEKKIFDISDEPLYLKTSRLLFNLYVEERYPELTLYFTEINSRTQFNDLSETEDVFISRMNSIREIKKTFFKIYDQVKAFRGSKGFFDFIIRYYLRMKYNMSDTSIEVSIFETSAFSYLITSNLSDKEFETIIKPIAHPNGWNGTYVSVNQFSEKNFFGILPLGIKKQEDAISVQNAFLDYFKFFPKFTTTPMKEYSTLTNFTVRTVIFFQVTVPSKTVVFSIIELKFGFTLPVFPLDIHL
jgi:hypothetical protein